jgi:hypothetical protein
VAVEWCDNCNETEWKDSSMVGEEVDIYTAQLDCDNCQMAVTKQTICVFCGAKSEMVTPIVLIEVEVPVSVYTQKEGTGGTGDPITCDLVLGTKKVCLLGCDPDESGTPITLELDRIDPLTKAELGFDTDPEVEDPTELCVTPYTTPTFVLGCIEDEEEGTPSCVPIEPCPPSGTGG